MSISVHIVIVSYSYIVITFSFFIWSRPRLSCQCSDEGLSRSFHPESEPGGDLHGFTLRQRYGAYDLHVAPGDGLGRRCGARGEADPGCEKTATAVAPQAMGI